MHRPATSFVIALAVAICGHAVAADSSGHAAEKSQIDSERRAAQARYEAREKECRDRFVVSSCVADAKRDRRVALDALRARQTVIDEAARRERAALRQSEIGAKAKEDARRDQARAAKAASAAEAASQAPTAAPASTLPASSAEAAAAEPAASRAARRPPAHGRPAVRHESARKTVAPQERQQHEDEKRAAYERRQEQAEEHRKDVATRVAKPGGKKAALPLPLPASAPASAARGRPADAG